MRLAGKLKEVCQCPLWVVISGNTHNEPMLSALPPKAGIERTFSLGVRWVTIASVVERGKLLRLATLQSE